MVVLHLYTYASPWAYFCVLQITGPTLDKLFFIVYLQVLFCVMKEEAHVHWIVLCRL